jgi:hypothetical protein
MAADFWVDRIKDNRLRGLLREISEAIEETDDAEGARAFGQSLKGLADRARGRGWLLTGGRKPW